MSCTLKVYKIDKKIDQVNMFSLYFIKVGLEFFFVIIFDNFTLFLQRNVLFFGRTFGHFENFDFDGVGQCVRKRFVQFSQSVHFHHAVDQDGEGVFGAAPGLLGHQSVHGIQPFGRQANVNVGQIGQRQKCVQSFSVDRCHL